MILRSVPAIVLATVGAAEAVVNVPCVIAAEDTSPNTVLVKTAVLPVPAAMVKLVSVPVNAPRAVKLAPVKVPSKAARRLAALVKAVAVNVLPARVNASPMAKSPKVTVCVSATPAVPVVKVSVTVPEVAGAAVAPTEVDVNVRPAVPASPPIVKLAKPPLGIFIEPLVIPVVKLALAVVCPLAARNASAT